MCWLLYIAVPAMFSQTVDLKQFGWTKLAAPSDKQLFSGFNLEKIFAFDLPRVTFLSENRLIAYETVDRVPKLCPSVCMVGFFVDAHGKRLEHRHSWLTTHRTSGQSSVNRIFQIPGGYIVATASGLTQYDDSYREVESRAVPHLDSAYEYWSLEVLGGGTLAYQELQGTREMVQFLQDGLSQVTDTVTLDGNLAALHTVPMAHSVVLSSLMGVEEVLSDGSKHLLCAATVCGRSPWVQQAGKDAVIVLHDDCLRLVNRSGQSVWNYCVNDQGRKSESKSVLNVVTNPSSQLGLIEVGGKGQLDHFPVSTRGTWLKFDFRSGTPICRFPDVHSPEVAISPSGGAIGYVEGTALKVTSDCR